MTAVPEPPTVTSEQLPSNIVMGEDVLIERAGSFDVFSSTLEPGLVLHDGVRVFTWTAFNVQPEGFIEVGAGSILVGAVFMCAERIQIGARVLISYGVTIADSDFHPRDPALRMADALANAPHAGSTPRPPFRTEPVVVEDDVQIGIGAIVLKGVRIARGARVGAGAVVTSHIPAGSHVAGNPARLSGGSDQR